MYIKIFESRDSCKSYIINQILDISGYELGKIAIENQFHDAIYIKEHELFNLIDTFFKSKCDEKSKSND